MSDVGWEYDTWTPMNLSCHRVDWACETDEGREIDCPDDRKGPVSFRLGVPGGSRVSVADVQYQYISTNLQEVADGKRTGDSVSLFKQVQLY